MKIIVGQIFPDILNLYGDAGNIAAIKYRLEKRGIEAQIRQYTTDDEIDFSNLDIVFIGGGGEREQQTACEKLALQKDKLVSYAEDGGVVLAFCGGFEIIGKSYTIGDEIVEGVGVLDITTTYGEKRRIGNVLLESDILDTTVVGFENHSGIINIGSYKPLGRVVSGFGNNGEDGTEGVVYKNVVATYLHGPLLPKNPALTDYILKKALERKYGEVELPPLDDDAEIKAHEYMAGRIIGK